MAAPFVYIPQPQNDRISIFDLSTNGQRSSTARKPGEPVQIATLPVQRNPVAVAPNLAGTLVYVVNHDSNSITIINSSNNTVQQTFAVCSQPIAATVSRNDKKLYVACEGDNSISVIDTSNNSQLKSINLNNRPTQMAISDGGRLYLMSSSGKTVQAFDTNTEATLFTINTDVTDANAKKNAGTPLAMSVQTDDMLYVGAEDGNVYGWQVADPKNISLQPRLQVKEKPTGVKRTIKAIDNYNTTIYIALNDGDIIIAAGITATVDTQKTISTATTPTGVNISNNFATATVTNSSSNSVAVISTTDNSVTYVDIGAPSAANGRFIGAPSFQTSIATHSQEEENNTYAWNIVTLQIKRFGNINGSAKVHYQTESGSAFTKWDFLETKGDLEFLPGEESKEISIQIIGDQTVEDYENFYVKLSNPEDGYNVGPQGITEITLINDDSLPTGAGCSIGQNKDIDPVLPLLAISTFAWLSRRRRKQI